MWFDNLVEIADQPTVCKRLQQFTELSEKAVKAARETAKSVLSRKAPGAGDSPSRATARQLVDLLHGPGPLGDVWKGILVAEERFEAHNDMVLLAFALAGYRHDRQAIPRN